MECAGIHVQVTIRRAIQFNGSTLGSESGVVAGEVAYCADDSRGDVMAEICAVRDVYAHVLEIQDPSGHQDRSAVARSWPPGERGSAMDVDGPAAVEDQIPVQVYASVAVSEIDDALSLDPDSSVNAVIRQIQGGEGSSPDLEATMGPVILGTAYLSARGIEDQAARGLGQFEHIEDLPLVNALGGVQMQVPIEDHPGIGFHKSVWTHLIPPVLFEIDGAVGGVQGGSSADGERTVQAEVGFQGHIDAQVCFEAVKMRSGAQGDGPVLVHCHDQGPGYPTQAGAPVLRSSKFPRRVMSTAALL